MRKILKSLLLIPLLGVVLSSCGKDSTAAGGEDTAVLRIVSTEGEPVSSLDFSSGSGKMSLRVESTLQWTLSVESDGGWLSASASKGSGNFKFSISVSANYDSSPREGKLTLSAGGMDDVTVTVRQGAKEDVKGVQIRVMSFNLRVGGKADGSTDEQGHEWTTVRKAPVIKMFSAISPDIVLMQECRQEQLDDLQAALSDKYLFYFFAIDSTLKDGEKESCTENVFLYSGARQVIMLAKDKFEMSGWGRFYLSSTPDVMSPSDGTQTKKVTLWLRVKLQGVSDPLYLFDTHFVTPSRGDVIADNAKVNVEQIKKIIGDGTVSGKSKSAMKLFFAGDLNCDESDSRLSELNKYLPLARTGATSPEDKPTYNGYYTDSSRWTRLDHIYYLNATPLTYRVVDSASYGTAFLSDHFPIWCDFFVKSVE